MGLKRFLLYLGKSSNFISKLLKRFHFFNNLQGIGVPEGYVEHSTFWLKDDNDLILGTVNIRHRLNDSLRREGGHIGYGVAPPYRNRGCATRMLELALEKANGLGITDALITCDKDNAASARVALKNGGLLDSEEFYNGRLIQRYWITTQHP